MSILIKDMEMPKEGFVEILVRSDGAVQQTGQSYRIDGTDYYTPYVGEMPVMYKAIPVPPHGDLVDLKAPFKAQYYDEMTEEWLEKTVTVEDVLYGCMVDEMPPTIIPAEEE